MFNVYITYFKNTDGTINSSSSETLMFTVPNTTNDFPVANPVVKSSENSADSFDFTMQKNSSCFDSLIRLKTRIRVEYDGDTIFYGRVLTIGESSFFGTKNVHCEGAYSFFNDTYYEGVPAKDGKKTTWSDYYNKIFQNHNNQISSVDPWKVINRGTVDFTPVEEERKFDPSSWSQTISLFSSLTSTFGGHVRVRYTNGASYLDWYKYYWRDLGANNRPFVEIAKNILDISSDNKVDNVFTRVIAIGDTDHNGKPIYLDGYKYTDKNGQQHTHSGKYIPVTLMCDLFTQQQLTDEFHSYYDYEQAENDYGVIYKTESFSDANTPEKLWSYVTDWIKKSYFGIADSFTVKAVDLHVVDNAYPKILCGECVDVKYYKIQNGEKIWIVKKLICKSAQYDLFKPENNTYIFGIPSDLLTHNYTEQRKKQEASAAGGGSKVPPGYDPDAPVTFRSMAELIGTNYTGHSPYVAPYYGTAARNSMLENGPLSATATLYDPTETNDPIANPDKVFNVEVIGRISLSGYDHIFVAVCDKGACAFRASTRHNWGYMPAAVDLWYFKKNGTKFYSSSKIASAVTAGAVAGIGVFGPTGLKITAGLYNEGDDAGVRVKHSLTDKIAVGISGLASKIRLRDPNADRDAVEINGSESKLILKDTVRDKITAAVDGLSGLFKLRNSTEDKDTIKFDGMGETALIGLNGSDFRIKINEPASYTDESGTSHSNVRGFVIAEDLKLLDDDTLRSVDSFKSDRVVTKQLIADKATIAQLNALRANINTLLAEYAKISYVEANYIQADSIDSSRILISKSLAVGSTGSLVNLYNGNVQANSIIVNSGGGIRLNGSGSGEYYDISSSNIQGFIKQASVDEATNTLTLVPVHGDPINFSKALATKLTGSWGKSTGSRNVYTVVADDEHIPPLSIRVNTMFSAGNGLFSVGTYQTDLSSNPLSVQETFTTYKLGLNGTDIELQYNSNDEKIPDTPVYNIGSELAGAWAEAYGKVVLPSANTSSAFITVKTPASTSTGGTSGQNTNEYYVTADDTNAYIRSGSTTGTIVAQSSILGWTAAYNQVELPSTEGNTASIVVKTPASSSSDSSIQVSTTYTMSSFDNNVVQLKNGNVIVAKFSHNKYIQGQNSVTITKGSWSSGQVTFDKSAGTASTKGVKVGLTGSWGTGDNAGIYSYTIKDYYDNAQGVSTGYTGTVNATSYGNTRYNAGVTAGTTAGQNGVTITKGSWSSGQVTFTKSAGTASTKGVKVGLDGSWGTGDNVNKYSYTIKDYYDNAQGVSTGYTGTVDATARYNAGVTAGTTAGQNGVTITKGSWSSGQVTFTKSAGTASTKGVKVGLTGSWGTGDNVNKYSYTIKDYYDNAQGVSTGYTGTVDATARYNAGVTAGTTAGQNGVTITKGSWSSGQVTFTKSAGTASTKGVKVGLDGSWSDNKYSYTIKDYYDNTQGVSTGYTGSITAPTPSISFSATDQGDPSSDVNDKAITATAKIGSTTVATATQVIHMTEGSWNSSAKKAVNVRLTNSSGALVTRLWISIPTISMTCTNTAAFYYVIKATCGNKSLSKTLKTNSSGGYVSFK